MYQYFNKLFKIKPNLFVKKFTIFISIYSIKEKTITLQFNLFLNKQSLYTDS